jgi:hypothetical protein
MWIYIMVVYDVYLPCRLVLDFSSHLSLPVLRFASSPAGTGKPLDGFFLFYLLPFAFDR